MEKKEDRRMQYQKWRRKISIIKEEIEEKRRKDWTRGKYKGTTKRNKNQKKKITA
jgi:hypothetical protein